MKYPPTQDLIGDSVVLIPMSAEHTDLVVKWRNDPHVSIWFNSAGAISSEAHDAWFEKYRDNPRDYTFIITTTERVPVGMIALYNIDRALSEAEYGRLLVDPQYRGRKFGFAASCCLLDFGRRLGLKQVYLSVKAHNHAAIMLYKDLGFVVDNRRLGEENNISMILNYGDTSGER